MIFSQFKHKFHTKNSICAPPTPTLGRSVYGSFSVPRYFCDIRHNLIINRISPYVGKDLMSDTKTCIFLTTACWLKLSRFVYIRYQHWCRRYKVSSFRFLPTQGVCGKMALFGATCHPQTTWFLNYLHFINIILGQNICQKESKRFFFQTTLLCF